MSGPHRNLGSHRALAEQAAEWLITLEEEEEDGAGTRARFAAWLGRSAAHVEEFLFACSVYREFNRHLPRREGGIDALVALARGHAGARVVRIAAQSVDRGEIRHKPTLASRGARRRTLATAASLALLAVAAAWALATWPRWYGYATDAGEQRALELADGSLVHLNGGSRLRVRLGGEVRELRLVRGEALFQVAPDPARPFQVRAGQTLIQAVGTAFNVDRGERGTTVSVLEGAVRISDARVILRPGEQARIVPTGGVEHRAGVDTTGMAAWRQRRLVFIDEPLADIAQAFNRHNRTPKIRIADEAAGRTRLSGVFDADDPQSMLLFVDDLGGLAVRRSDTEVMILIRPDPMAD